jgi:hypothetical protein
MSITDTEDNDIPITITYTAGERPEPIDYQFLDANGNPIPLTGFTGSATIRVNGVKTSYGTSNVTITDADNAVATFTWPDSVLDDEAVYRLKIWVTSASNRFASRAIDVTANDDGGIPTP